MKHVRAGIQYADEYKNNNNILKCRNDRILNIVNRIEHE